MIIGRVLMFLVCARPVELGVFAPLLSQTRGRFGASRTVKFVRSSNPIFRQIGVRHKCLHGKSGKLSLIIN